MYLTKKGNLKFTLLMCFITFSVVLNAQASETIRHCTVAEGKIDFNIAISDKKMHYKNECFYYWFKSQKIHETQGRAAGNVLHGGYFKYDLDGVLIEQGSFKYGLKVGEWITWYPTGKLKSINNYKKGVKNGTFILFDAKGEITKSGKYEKGEVKSRKEIKQKKEEIEPEVKEKKNSLLDQLTKKTKDERKLTRLENKNKRKAERTEKAEKKE